jgi:hypothetical protein
MWCAWSDQIEWLVRDGVRFRSIDRSIASMHAIAESLDPSQHPPARTHARTDSQPLPLPCMWRAAVPNRSIDRSMQWSIDRFPASSPHHPIIITIGCVGGDVVMAERSR